MLKIMFKSSQKKAKGIGLCPKSFAFFRILIIMLLCLNTLSISKPILVYASDVQYVATEKEEREDIERTGFFESVGNFFKNMFDLLNPFSESFFLKIAFIPKDDYFKNLMTKSKDRFFKLFDIKPNVGSINLRVFGVDPLTGYMVNTINMTIYIILGLYCFNRIRVLLGGVE